MTVILLAVTLLGFIFAAAAAFRSGADNLGWELRWQGLDAGDLARISTAARSRDWRSSLTDPEELELAAGLRRRDRRRRAYVELAVLPVLLVATVLALIGLVDVAAVGLVFGLSAVFTDLWDYLRTRRMSGEPRPVTSPGSAL
jgi:hypothetical protein